MKVILSAKAIEPLETLLDYLESEFSLQTRRNFQKRLDRFIKALKITPRAFPESKIFKGC